MPTAAIRPIDYTNIGYASLRDAMLQLARERLPEWTDFSEGDLGVLLVELFSYASDITLYYQTRIAANLLPETADEPDPLIQLLRLIGYELRPPTPATVNLRVAFDQNVPTTPPLVLQEGSPFVAALPDGTQIRFEAEHDVTITSVLLQPPNPAAVPSEPSNQVFFYPVPAMHGETIKDEIVTEGADASANQMYPLKRGPVVGTVRLTVVDAGEASVWTQVETLAYSGPADRHFVVHRDAAGGATLVFGDGANGVTPGPATTGFTMKASYRIGGGPLGNVAAGTRFTAPAPAKWATNPTAAAGGAEAESPERARRLAPRLFRTQERAVTERDYEEIALQVPGVGKVRAVALNWNEVVLYVAPSGQVADISDLLRRDILSYLESRRMVTTTLRVVSPKSADVYLRAEVNAKPYYLRSQVRARVEEAVAAYLAFDNIDFGQPVYLSRIYDAIQSLDEVESVNVTQFSRSSTLLEVAGGGVIKIAPNELARPGYRDNLKTPPDPANPNDRPPIVVVIVGGVAG